MKIIIDPADDIQYKSFYIYALIQRFGNENVRFSDAPFRDLTDSTRNTKSMRFITVDGTNEKRYAVHCDDKYTIHDELYRWADVYGCVNTNWAKTPEHYHAKLVSLCPSFAIRYISPFNAVIKAAATLPYCHTNPKKHLGRWKRLLHRPTYEDYSRYPLHTTHYPLSIFHLSTLWQSDEWNRNDETVNLHRANFIRVCKCIPEVRFEGGLVSHRSDEAAHQFDDCMTHPYGQIAYLKLTQQSAFVFNTPAYWGCHGWKLGEYMAMGKAMISTPLGNDLPAPLKHGKHYHLIEETDPESLHEAITFLLSHPGYCSVLASSLLRYWNIYGSPEATLKLLGI